MSKIKMVDPSKKNKKNPKLCWSKITPKLVAQALVVIAVFGMFIFALPLLPQIPTTTAQSNYQGVVNLWVVDSFEGGSGSRKSWFTARSAQYEKQNEGLFVCVTTLTEEQLLTNLQSGQSFDLLCFSRGVGAKVSRYLAPLKVDTGAVFQGIALSGKMNNTTYAVPIFCGTYCLFSRQSQLKDNLIANCLSTTFTRKVGKNTFDLAPLVCGFTNYNSPLTALAMSGAKGKANVDYSTTQYLAYEQFVANKTAVTLLGTQRDLYRLTQKQSMGKIEQLSFAPLVGYTDLVEYVAVSNSTDKTDVCQKFIQYLLSDAVQQSLVNLSMFSVTQQNLYSQEWYHTCEQVLADAYVPNVFADQSSISQQRQVAISTLQTQ